MESLPGWGAEDHAAAFAAVQGACAQEPRARRPRVCDKILAEGRLGEVEARRFLDARFRAEPVPGEGLLTAYYAPLYQARRAPDDQFSAPVRPPPADPAFAPARAQIDRQPADDALAWMRPEDLYFLQVQGSGVLDFPDGERERAVFAASNGRPYVAIAHPMEA
ncbi:MAG: MltA domain-containing protein, partial [Caulobacteraceae bacterium]